MTQFFSTFWYVILLPLQGLLLWCCHVWFRINQILTHLHGCLVSPVPWIAPLYWQKAKIRSHIFPKMVPGWWSFAREMLLLQRQIKNFVRCVKKTSTFKQKTPSQMHPQFRFQFFHFFSHTILSSNHAILFVVHQVMAIAMSSRVVVHITVLLLLR